MHAAAAAQQPAPRPAAPNLCVGAAHSLRDQLHAREVDALRVLARDGAGLKVQDVPAGGIGGWTRWGEPWGSRRPLPRSLARARRASARAERAGGRAGSWARALRDVALYLLSVEAWPLVKSVVYT